MADEKFDVPQAPLDGPPIAGKESPRPVVPQAPSDVAAKPQGEGGRITAPQAPSS